MIDTCELSTMNTDVHSEKIHESMSASELNFIGRYVKKKKKKTAVN